MNIITHSMLCKFHQNQTSLLRNCKQSTDFRGSHEFNHMFFVKVKGTYLHCYGDQLFPSYLTLRKKHIPDPRKAEDEVALFSTLRFSKAQATEWSLFRPVYLLPRITRRNGAKIFSLVRHRFRKIEPFVKCCV